MSDRERIVNPGAGGEPAPDPPAPEPRVTDKRKTADAPPAAAAEVAQEVPELDRAKAEAVGYLDDLRRLKAEFENYRKRVIKEQTAVVESAAAAVVEMLLPVLDNFELALIAADRTKDYEALVRGVELVYGELQDVLRKEGLKRIEAEGRPFDPGMHEAVMEGEGLGDEAVVAEVFRNGYTLNGKVIRAAMVKVERR